jgi:SAM-dependent methyltransferase
MRDVANAEQLAAWDGEEGEHWSRHEDHYDAAMRAHAHVLAEAAAIAAADFVLDVGCGNGSTTRDAARAAVDGAALGIDLSSAMLENARRRAAEEGIANVTFVHGDAQVHEFEPNVFDVVVSRFGAMFFEDPVAALTNVGEATRAGGRLALAAWQRLEDNEWLSAVRGAVAQGRELPSPPPHAPGPFGFADPERVRTILDAAGYRAVSIVDASAPVCFGTDPDDAFDFLKDVGVVRGLLADLAPDRQQVALDDLRAVLDAHAGGDGVLFDSRMWVITALR